MSDKAIVCVCRGCGKQCALTEDELVSYKQSMSTKSITKYPKCGRSILDGLDIFTYK